MFPNVLRNALVATCAGSLLSACGAPATPAAPPTALVREDTRVLVPTGSPLRSSLRVEPVRSVQIAPTIQAPAVIEVLPERLVRIVPPLAGRVITLQRTLGATVKAGDVLCVIDSAELGNAYSDDGKARAALAQARQEFERQKALYEGDIAAKKDYQAAQQTLASTENDARAAADRLAQLGVPASASSHRQYLLRSPISGRVTDVTASLGGYWNDTSSPLMTIADISSVWLTASVAEKDIGQVFEGQPVSVTLDAYPGQTFDGRVQHIDDLLDTTTRTLKVRVALDNRDGRFKPGMFARAGFAARPHPALMVPDTALLQSGLYTRVFVETTPFAYVSRIVSTGSALDGDTEIVSGLKAGERIVVKDGTLLND
jgi:cobalt-zinc-cadmium efflux system membrane fusion protein